MSSIFAQFDKPFYFAGDTIEGHVYMYLVEPISANELTVKFKGWEVVRWIEERILSEQERQNIDHNRVWNQVVFLLMKDFRVRMDSSDSEDEYQDESTKYNYVKRGQNIVEVRRYTGGRIISRFSHILYHFGGTFIPPGQYSFPFRFKTGEDYPASFSVAINLCRINLRTTMRREESNMNFRHLLECPTEDEG
jgi:hypothetical protein